MKGIYISIVFLILSCPIFGQELGVREKLFEPQEKVFVDYNSSLVFPGEYLYYKIYVVNDKINQLSSLSKIAYVKMINEDGEAIFTHKISSGSGTGNGDFFVPTDIASGTYKLIAFTEWMYNKSATNYFSGTVFIINPYTTKHENSLERFPKRQIEKENSAISGKGIIKLSKKGAFRKREQIRIQLDSAKLAGGNYSLSVYKKNDSPVSEKINISNFKQVYNSKTSTKDSSKNSVLPELRGDLFKGRLATNNKNLSVANRSMAVSVPGDNFQLKISNTNEEGVFYFNLGVEQSVDELFIQVLGEDAGQFEVRLDSLANFDYSILDFPKLKISPAMESEIIARSVQNQIENSYYSIKPDTLKVLGKEKPFFGSKNIENFPLDDYTRFPTVKETFVEVITSAKIRKDENGKSIFGVYSKNSEVTFISSALLLVDGLYIENTEALMNYSANKIARIQVVRNEYYYGSKIFGGIISIETKEKDFMENYQSSSLKKFDIVPVKTSKDYYVVNYKNQDLDRIPDFRRQLLWKPNLTDFETIDFFTSDIKGDFMITLQGIDKNGKTIFDQKEFQVK